MRIPVLDGIRGLAILLVLQYHFAEGLTNLNPVEAFSYGLLRTGWIGVDLFFVLSGFLITGILFDSKSSSHYFRNFYVRRLLRIFPAYYGFLVLALLVLPLIKQINTPMMQAAISNQWWYWLHITNIGVAVNASATQMFGHFWSLAIEEQFYLFWPLLIFSLSLRKAMIACLACIAFSLALRLTLLSAGIGNPATAVLTPCRLDALALGGWLALAQRRGWFTARLTRWAGIMFSICLFLFAVAFLRNGFKVEADDLGVQSVGYTVIAVMFGALIVLALSRGWFSFLNTPFFRLCGKYSYMMYIIHLPLHGALYKIFQTQQITASLPSPMLRLLPFNLFATLACIGIAAVTWRLYESQFLKLKKRFS